MSDGMVERVARAIKARSEVRFVPYVVRDDIAADFARAVIKAMREPTDAMCQSGFRSGADHMCSMSYAFPSQTCGAP